MAAATGTPRAPRVLRPAHGHHPRVQRRPLGARRALHPGPDPRQLRRAARDAGVLQGHDAHAAPGPHRHGARAGHRLSLRVSHGAWTALGPDGPAPRGPATTAGERRRPHLRLDRGPGARRPGQHAAAGARPDEPAGEVPLQRDRHRHRPPARLLPVHGPAAQLCAPEARPAARGGGPHPRRRLSDRVLEGDPAAQRAGDRRGLDAGLHAQRRRLRHAGADGRRRDQRDGHPGRAADPRPRELAPGSGCRGDPGVHHPARRGRLQSLPRGEHRRLPA